MSLVKRSLAGVDEFEDSDTKNRFYRWRDIKAEAERLDNEEDQEITRGAASLRHLEPYGVDAMMWSRRWRQCDAKSLRRVDAMPSRCDAVDVAVETLRASRESRGSSRRDAFVTPSSTQVHAGGRL